MNKSTLISVLAALSITSVKADTIPHLFKLPVEWHAGVEVSPAFVPNTNGFLRGSNDFERKVNSTLGADIRADFSFNPMTLEGRLFPGLYQGIGIGVNTYFANELLGTPISAYVYQGAPIVKFSKNFWLGYEWQFGVAAGWEHYDRQTADNNAVVSTSVTAHMGLGFKLHYNVTDRLNLSFGIDAAHYSNGNTSWPNAGINSVGASIGFAYTLNPQKSSSTLSLFSGEETYGQHWFYDLMAYGAWRKRVVLIGTPAEPELCPGKFGIAGFQFSPMRQLTRWVAVGAALDLQWDESAGLSPYWVDGTSNEDMKFKRPPFGKQLSVGLSAHAELTMPIFSVNAGLGYDVINPKGDKAFYQSLTLKTFITKRVYLNVGYRLGSFKDPQNLMLGVGVRLGR